MATVYLAHDLRHDRSVALKVLHPDLTATLGPDRFQREIRYAARLQHPHILTVLDSGESGGQLWFTMPYVEGESLRERLTRDRQLSLEDALRIGREAAQALQYSHEHDVLHRDIKPENLLLTRDGNTLVADFGVARALASEEALTQTGLTVGTPAYMSPEQAAGERQLDARSDIYSLGCVLYEMLCGEPPFTGPTAQAIMAKRFSTSPTPVRVTRPEVPADVDDVVQRALARTPADRFASAGEMAQSLRPSVATPAATRVLERAPARHQEGSHRTGWLVAGGVAALTLVAMVALMRNHEQPAALDRSVIAVAPFRVTGADSSLGYLREGMVDLLSTKLSGTAALRPADPRTLLAAWGRAARGGGELPEDDAVRVAAALGAGRMVEGEVVGSRGRVSLSARIVDVPSGSVRARATAEGSPDSLTQLVDRLAATLLALGSGEGEQRLAGLTSTSLPALRAYLDGEALLRRGTFGEASEKFFDAFQIDSTFALAGVGTARAGEWKTSGRSDAPVKAAWRHRDRLSARDLASLTAILGPGYPAPSRARDKVEAAERLVELAPDSPGAWYNLADGLFHFGALASIPEALPRAVAAFARSLTLDSSYAPTIQHLTEVAALLDDTAGVLRGRALLRQIDSVSSFTIARLLHPAAWLGDTAEVRRLLASDSALGPLPTNLLVYALDGAVPSDTGGVEDLYRRAYAQAATAEERKVTALIWSRYELASGRPGKSPSLSRDWPGIGRQSLAVLDGLFADGDSGLAAEGARSLERQLGSRFAAADLDATLARYAVGQYNLKVGNLSPVRLAIADLRQAKPHPDSVWQADEPRAFALLLEAQLNAREGSPEARKRLRPLDSVLANPRVPFNPFDFGRPPLFTYGNLVAARLHEEAGDTVAALAALRRRVIGIATYPHYVRYRREEGRLAASVGDTAGAIRAYRHYLALRSTPDPRLRAQADTVRIELAELLRAVGRH
jgi:TolB-like protein